MNEDFINGAEELLKLHREGKARVLLQIMVVDDENGIPNEICHICKTNNSMELCALVGYLENVKDNLCYGDDDE